jgi:hypothetical protein
MITASTINTNAEPIKKAEEMRKSVDDSVVPRLAVRL